MILFLGIILDIYFKNMDNFKLKGVDLDKKCFYIISSNGWSFDLTVIKDIDVDTFPFNDYKTTNERLYTSTPLGALYSYMVDIKLREFKDSLEEKELLKHFKNKTNE